MNCSPDLIEAFFDGELDASQQAAVAEHLAECKGCNDVHARLQSQRESILSSAPYYDAPPALHVAVRNAVRRSAPAESGPRQTPWRAMAIAASLLLMFSVAWNVVQLRMQPVEDVSRGVLAGHIRSLIGTHLLDVVSTDQHTVKPWFAGKLEFSPDVKDLAPQGFPLAGGRVDYLADRRVAALIYYRRQHAITLYMWPSGGSSGPDGSLSRDGYNVLHWTGPSMTYWAVSDVSAPELKTFRNLFR